MKRQLNLFRHALMFYSRIPTGKIEYSEANLTQSFRYFPLVGIIVGAAGGGIYWLFRLAFPHPVAVVAAIATMVLATGALHEDGFSDFFDGFGGGRTKERILSIMKDSATGAYGVIAIVLLFLMKFSLMILVDPPAFLLVAVAAHASSRLMPVVLVNTSRYARTENSKAMHTRNKTGGATFLTALVFAAVPLLFVPRTIALSIISVYAIIWFLLKTYTENRIGGFTGDVLGAMQQFSELAFYLVYVGFAANTP